jgi:hypothetical protein
MDPQFPTVDEKGKQAMLTCRETLTGECGDGAPQKPATAAPAKSDAKKDKKKSKKK